MRARSITRVARSSIPQSQATATLPRTPSLRGTSFHPVPLQSVQFSRAICGRQILCGSRFSSGHGFSRATSIQINKALAAEGLACDVHCKAYGRKRSPASQVLGKLWKDCTKKNGSASILLTIALLTLSNRNSYHPRISPHNSMPLWPVLMSRRHPRQLLLHHMRKLLHLVLHLNHLLPHI